MSLKKKIFLAFLVYGFFVFVTVEFVNYSFDRKYIVKQWIDNAKSYAYKVQKDTRRFAWGHRRILEVLQESEIFTKHYKPQEPISPLLNTLFLDLAKTQDDIMQLRFIDNDGNERIRVDRIRSQAPVFLVKPQDLQNKKDRYYFQETMALKAGEIWYSKIDLNMEHGKIEYPLKPVLRVATPVEIDGKRVGMFIVNIFAKQFLKSIMQTSMFDVYLIDSDGHILVEPTHQHCWQHYLPQNRAYKPPFAEKLQDIIHAKKYATNNFYARALQMDSKENLHVVVMLKPEFIERSYKEQLRKFALSLSLTLLVGLVLSLPFTRYFDVLTKKLDQLNTRLGEENKQKNELLLLFEIGDAVLFRWNNDEHWSIEYVSGSIERFSGYTKAEFESGEVEYAHLIEKDDLAQVSREVSEAVQTKQKFLTHEPYRIKSKDGSIKWVLDYTVLVYDEKNNLTSFLGYLWDMTEIKNSQEELKHLARTDPLTKLYNRLYLDEMLTNQYFRFVRNDEVCSVIIIDIDHFKNINDTYGHFVGDDVLVEAAKLLKESIRINDIIGRWGGEEFLLILPHTDLKSAAQLAHKLRQNVKKHLFVQNIEVTISLGVAQLQKGIDVETWLIHADTALYDAKDAGRDCVKVYHG